MASCPRPYWLLIGWGAATFAPFGPSSRHPLGAGSSAGDVPINPTVRVKEGGMGHVCFLFVPLILYYVDSESKTVATVFYLLQDPSISI